MDIDLYTTLIKQNFPEIEIRTATLNQEGWDSRILDINGELIFRFPRNAEAEANLEMQKQLLEMLGPVVSLPLPTFEFDCRVEGHEFGRFAGYRKLPGEPLSTEHLHPPNRSRRLSGPGSGHTGYARTPGPYESVPARSRN